MKIHPRTKYLNINRKFVPKGWGHEEWIVNNDKYCGKKLQFHEGRKCSFHYHKLKDETFFVVKGKVQIRFVEPDYLKEAEQIFLKKEYHIAELVAGQSFHIPVKMAHQVFALMNSTIIEFSTTHYDEDSIRIIPGD